MDGFLLIDKPAGVTSRAVCMQAAQRLGVRTGRKGTRIGHAGTLDPFATGLLIVLVGRATRLMSYVVGHDKRYTVEVLLGIRSDTDDITGQCETAGDLSNISETQIRSAVEEIARSTTQIPPAVSAIHVDGVRAWKRIRRGESINVAPRTVRFDWIDIQGIHHGFDGTRVTLDVRCSAGTYMRSVARDLGDMLGVGGVASALRRTSSGGFVIDQTISLDTLSAVDVCQSRDLVTDLPAIELEPHDVQHVMHGRQLQTDADDWPTDSSIALIERSTSTLIGIGRVTGRGTLAPRTVLVQPSDVEVVDAHV